VEKQLPKRPCQWHWMSSATYSPRSQIPLDSFLLVWQRTYGQILESCLLSSIWCMTANRVWLKQILMHQELEDYIVGLVYSRVSLLHLVSCWPERSILDPFLIAISIFLLFRSERPDMASKSLCTRRSLMQCDPTSQPLTFLNAAHAPDEPRLDVRRWIFWQQTATDCCLTVPDPASSARYSFHSSTDKPDSWGDQRNRSHRLVVGRSRRWHPPWEAILHCLCC